MHLLSSIQINMDDLENQMYEIDNFPITIAARNAYQLEERYEAKNTRLLIDVNMGENDIVQEHLQTHDTEKRKVLTKMKHVDETISILKTRRIEAYRKNEMLTAPKRAEQKRKQEQEKMGNKKKK